jgi:hypothetical protein
MWREALFLLAAAATSIYQMPTSDADLVSLLDRTVWIDIGLGRKLANLTPGQIAELKRCKEPTMALEKSGGVWMQSFYAGIEIRTIYTSAVLKSDSAGETVLFYSAGKPTPAEILHISHNEDVAVEQTRGFRPRIFLKCSPPKAAGRKH